MIDLTALYKYEHKHLTCYASVIQTDGNQVKIDFKHPTKNEFVQKWVDESDLVRIGNNVCLNKLRNKFKD